MGLVEGCLPRNVGSRSWILLMAKDNDLSFSDCLISHAINLVTCYASILKSILHSCHAGSVCLILSQSALVSCARCSNIGTSCLGGWCQACHLSSLRGCLSSIACLLLQCLSCNLGCLACCLSSLVWIRQTSWKALAVPFVDHCAGVEHLALGLAGPALATTLGVRCQWQLCRCLLSRCRYLSTLAPTTSSLPLVERRSACQQVIHSLHFAGVRVCQAC
mmetsp:Transcript_80199/g.163238  ORF Transcript_80199/g.163238 Transcript_80199/m.163238 type:complete len:219 (-) Transcript_80199:629-1285(-)